MLNRLLLAAIAWLGLAAGAAAQTCPDRPAGDSTNACANTRFVNGGGLALANTHIFVGNGSNVATDFGTLATFSSNGTLNLNPTSGRGLNLTQTQTAASAEGILTQQTASGTYGNQNYNLFLISADTVNAGANFNIGVGINHTFGGSSMLGGRAALQALATLNGATNAANANRNYVGANLFATCATGDGGTNTGAGALGGCVGVNPYGVAQSGATNLVGVSGGEANVALQTGSTAKLKTGWSIVQHASDNVDAATLNTLLNLGSQTGGNKMTNAIAVTDVNGQFPVKTTGTIFGVVITGSTPSVTSAIDFTGVTITGSLLKGKGTIDLLGSTSGQGTITCAAACGTITATLPATSDTLVGKATTDTLTNKTLTDPLIAHVIGGTAAGSSLELRATSGAGVGAELVKVTGGNNGGTTFVTFTPGALFIEGAATPQVTMTVGGAGKAAFQWNNAGSQFLIDTQVAAAPILFRVNGSESVRANTASTASTSVTTGAVVIAGTGGLGVPGKTFTDSLNIVTVTNVSTTRALCWDNTTGLVSENGTVGTCTVSTLRAKDLVARLTPKEGFDLVMGMEPWRYTMKKGLPSYISGEQIGFIAEYALKKDRRVVAMNDDGTVGGFRYEQYTAALTGAIKYLKADVDNLRAELARRR